MSNVAFTIFGLSIYWYAVMIVTGILAAMCVAGFLLSKKGYKGDIVIDFAILTLPLAIIGARLYYVLFTLDSGWTFKTFWDIRSGGLAIYGGVIGGALGVALTCVFKKFTFDKFLDVADAVAPGLVLAQAIGRWGNFFNQEAHGDKVLEPAKQFFPYAVYVDGTIPGTDPVGWYRATFFYESMGNLIAAVILFVLAYKLCGRYKGVVLAGYLVLYGIVRVIVEGMRTDSLWWGSFRVSQLLSGLLIAGGAAIIVWRVLKDVSARKTAPLSPTEPPDGGLSEDAPPDGSALKLKKHKDDASE